MKTKTHTGPLVSVVIPCFNHASYVLESIQSVIDQDYENIELIVIDDGSKDDSIEKIQLLSERCKERFVRFEFRHRTNKGLSATLNEAIAWCQGEYYSAIASDDMMIREKTSIQVQYLINNPTCTGVFGGIHIINEVNFIIRTTSTQLNKYFFEEIFLMHHNLAAPTQMLRLNALKETGLYPANILIEDWYMWLAITSRGGRLDNTSSVLAKYRRHSTNFSNNYIAMDLARNLIIKKYADHALFEKARSNIIIMSAFEFIFIDKIKSVKKLITGASLNPINIFQKRILIYLLRMIMPNFLLKRYY